MSRLAPEQRTITPQACLKAVIGIQVEHSMVRDRIVETHRAYGLAPQRRDVACLQSRDNENEYYEQEQRWRNGVAIRLR